MSVIFRQEKVQIYLFLLKNIRRGIEVTEGQQRLSEEGDEEGVEEKTEQDTQPASIREPEAGQDSTKAAVQPAPGPSGELMTVWP